MYVFIGLSTGAQNRYDMVSTSGAVAGIHDIAYRSTAHTAVQVSCMDFVPVARSVNVQYPPAARRTFSAGLGGRLGSSTRTPQYCRLLRGRRYGFGMASRGSHNGLRTELSPLHLRGSIVTAKLQCSIHCKYCLLNQSPISFLEHVSVQHLWNINGSTLSSRGIISVLRPMKCRIQNSGPGFSRVLIRSTGVASRCHDCGGLQYVVVVVRLPPYRIAEREPSQSPTDNDTLAVTRRLQYTQAYIPSSRPTAFPPPPPLYDFRRDNVPNSTNRRCPQMRRGRQQ